MFSVGGGGTLAYIQAESTGLVMSVSSVAERVTVLAAAGAMETPAVTMSNGSVLRDSVVRTETPTGRGVYASYGEVHLVNVTAIATEAESSAVYADSALGGICVPDSHMLGAGDIDGQARTQGSAPDIGADEYVPPPPPPPETDTRRPVASLLAMTPARFRAATALATARRRPGTRISYALDENATVTFTVKRIVQRVVRGRRRNSYIPLRGAFRDTGEVGGNSLRFRGRIGGRRLRPGLYRLVALPVDAAGNTGNAVFIKFRIVR